MKLVKEILYEKFSEDSDPIRDLGIKADREQVRHFLYQQIYKLIDLDKNTEHLIRNINVGMPGKIRFDIGTKEDYSEYLEELLKQTKIDEYLIFPPKTDDVGRYFYNVKSSYFDYFDSIFQDKYKTPYKKEVNEKFVEDSDPIKDLGIGMICKIKEWLDNRRILSYTINDDLTIDVLTSVNLRGILNEYLPEYIQFNIVDGEFNVMSNKLKSLRGCPKEVKGNFHCTSNQLTNLIGAPVKVGENFCCGSNDLISLEGIPKFIGGEFYCTWNRGTKFNDQYVKSLCKIQSGITHFK